MLHCCKQSLDHSILVTSNLYVFLLQIYSVRVRVDTDYVLGLLLEKGQFDIAKKYAGIVESTASQVTIKEVS